MGIQRREVRSADGSIRLGWRLFDDKTGTYVDGIIRGDTASRDAISSRNHLSETKPPVVEMALGFGLGFVWIAFILTIFFVLIGG